LRLCPSGHLTTGSGQGSRTGSTIVAAVEIDEFFSRLHDPGDWGTGTVAAILARRDAEASAQPGPAAVAEVGELIIERPTVLDRTHHVAGDLRLGNHLLVLGDLHVGNLILGEPAHNILMVAGDVSCRLLELCRSYLLVAGTVRAAECVFVSTYGSSMSVGGFDTDLWLQAEWDNVDVKGSPVDNIRARHRFVRDYDDDDLETFDTAAVRPLLRPEAFAVDEDGEFDPFHLTDQIYQGKPWRSERY
jgi:hypothetical protein